MSGHTRTGNALIASERNWQPDDIIEIGENRVWRARYRITGIGESLVLARRCGYRPDDHGWLPHYSEWPEDAIRFGLDGAWKVD